MPLDDYSSLGGGGALRIKGAKVTKPKKKKRSKDKDGVDKGDLLEKALSPAEGDESKSLARREGSADEDADKRRGRKKEKSADADREGSPEEEDRPMPRMTEAQRRLEEVRRKRFLELAANPESRPELLKTHKERVEDLNSFLSKLSEHNDMPKIGPG